MKVELFTPGLEDIADLNTVEHLAWDLGGENLEAENDKIIQRLLAFQQGISLAVIEDGGIQKPAGSQFAFKFDWDGDPNTLTSWDEHTANGWYKKTHNPEGNTGFLVGVGVVPEYRGVKLVHNLRWEFKMKVSELLIARTLDNLCELGVQRVIGNARVPAFHTRSDLNIWEYCDLRRDDGKLYDPVLRFHEGMGAEILKPVEYSLDDPDSLNAGCWIVYKNKFNLIGL